jgi:hypothetical protein
LPVGSHVAIPEAHEMAPTWQGSPAGLQGAPASHVVDPASPSAASPPASGAIDAASPSAASVPASIDASALASGVTMAAWDDEV